VREFARTRRRRREKTGPEAAQLIMPPKLYLCPSEGKKLRTDRDAVDLIGDARSAGAGTIAIPVERLDEDFFVLRTRVAGEFAQKFVTYGVRLAILGDISKYKNDSKAFHDFVYEANRGRDLWFVASREELDQRLLTVTGI
jgi:hypothetical protein